MPTRVQHEVDRNLIVIHGEGALSDRDLGDVLAAIRGHPAVATVQGVLLDLSGATGIEVTSEGIRAVAERAREQQSAPGGLRLAAVADQDVAFGLARMYEIVRNDGGNVRVFRDLSAAFQWLAAPAGKEPPPA